MTTRYEIVFRTDTGALLFIGEGALQKQYDLKQSDPQIPALGTSLPFEPHLAKLMIESVEFRLGYRAGVVSRCSHLANNELLLMDSPEFTSGYEYGRTQWRE